MKFIKIFFLYLDTIKYLKTSQIFFRIYNFFEIKHVSKNVSFNVNTKLKKWTKPIIPKSSIFADNNFSFLNQKINVNTLEWKVDINDKLWRYNLEYFNFINTYNYKKIYSNSSLITKWIKANPPFRGLAWDRYPTSLRIVNWIKWSLDGNLLTKAELESLFLQARWIYKNPERHLLGNHFFANLKALVFAGCFFNTNETNKWLEWSVNQIDFQLVEQILDDGGHFERSPMYHSIFLEDILDLINISKTYNKIQNDIYLHWINISIKMFNWLKNMIHPDQEIAFFNDAAFNISSSYTDLKKYAIRLNVKINKKLYDNKNLDLCHLSDSGYIRVSTNNSVAIFDVAPIGPDYLPAHGHADTLSFEMSIFNQRFIVNGGTSCYGNSENRLLERKTRSHNTVEIDNKDSSEVWGNFRVAERAYPKNLNIKKSFDVIEISCSHDGYAKKREKTYHNRIWIIQENKIEIVDSITGNYLSAVSRIIFHPSIYVLQKNSSLFHFNLPKGEKVYCELFDCHGEKCISSYSPEFGVKQITSCIQINLDNKVSRIKLTW